MSVVNPTPAGRLVPFFATTGNFRSWIIAAVLNGIILALTATPTLLVVKVVF